MFERFLLYNAWYSKMWSWQYPSVWFCVLGREGHHSFGPSVPQCGGDQRTNAGGILLLSSWDGMAGLEFILCCWVLSLGLPVPHGHLPARGRAGVSLAKSLQCSVGETRPCSCHNHPAQEGLLSPNRELPWCVQVWGESQG